MLKKRYKNWKKKPTGGAVTPLDLSIVIAPLNARIRSSGMSSREFWTHRSQFTHEQIPISDRELILQQYQNRSDNQLPGSISKHKNGKFSSRPTLNVSNFIYLYSDKDKSHARSSLVVSIDGDWCYIKKFTGNQLRATSYKTNVKECYKVPSQFAPSSSHTQVKNFDDEIPSHPSQRDIIPRSTTNPNKYQILRKYKAQTTKIFRRLYLVRMS